MILLGIDPGLRGALTILSAPRGGREVVKDCIDIPVVGSDAQQTVDTNAVLSFIQRTPPDYAFIESAVSMLTDNRWGLLKYGIAWGILWACVDGLGLPIERASPVAWKNYHGLGRKKGIDKVPKDASRELALRKFPEAASLLSRKMDHNRAESALIASYGVAVKRGLLRRKA